ncbi:MAG TPA: protein kinase [Thermoanaerobaculia bacterium]|nr:protein kinase [Thermoanaerobaculia bacterium]
MDEGKGDHPAKIGNYRLEGLLGSGGMGVVYRAFDEALQRPLAIKHLLSEKSSPLASRRFRREARTAALLNHPAIVHIYDIVETDAGEWIVMELVEGKSLDRAIRDRSLDLAQALQLGREIAEGLAAAHAKGIVHRDLKASNVMVTPSGHAKILDFGLAKLVHQQSQSELSQPGVLLGTYHAMSPEQIQGLPVDHRSDLFSLGTLLYEMSTGVSPFRAATVTETLARICNLQQLPVCQIWETAPWELSDLIDRLLCKLPGERPASAGEVAGILERLERTGSSSIPSDGGLRLPVGSSPPKAGRRELSGEPTLDEGLAAKHLWIGGVPSLDPVPSVSSHKISERRQVTVVCCELAAVEDFEPLSQGELDSGDRYELMLQFRALAQALARRYSGQAASLPGQRMLIYFGYPQAHEDNARRAVRAALELASQGEQISACTQQGEPVRLAFRAGIHTGTAVFTTGRQDPGPVDLGETLQLAAALQALAEPGNVVVSPATCSLLQNSFSLEPLPPAQLPGHSGLVPLHRVLALLDVSEDSAVSSIPLVGRDQQIELLLSRWNLAREGTGQVVLISGEAGIGKSRLVAALRARLEEGVARWLACYGSAYTQNSPFRPVIGLLHQLLAHREGNTPLEQLENLLRELSLTESLPLLARLLDLPLEEGTAALQLSPDRRREKTMEALVVLTLELAERQPLVLLIEDLHWLDPTTLGWLDRLIDQTVTAPLFLVLTLRSHTLEVLWGLRAHLTPITLGALSETEAESLIDQVARDRPLTQAVRRQIIARTDGVPLFIEELTKAVLESSASEPWELPATLRDSLTARLDRLGKAKTIAQIASVIGRAFTLELLATLSPYDEATLQLELKRLVQAELVYRKGFGGRARYVFKHALVRDAAYDSLLGSEKGQIHLKIAQALEAKLFAAEVEQPELIARHYMAADRFEKAVEFWLAAGQQSIARFAHTEAIEHLQLGIQALASLPPGSDRDRQELPLQSALGASLGVVRGQASPELAAVYDRILALGERIEYFPEEIFFGLWNFYISRGNLLQARDLGQQRLRYGEENQDREFMFTGWYARAASDLFLGNLKLAREGFERVLSIYPDPQTRKASSPYDIGVISLSLLGGTLWLTGQPDTARRKEDEALAWSRGLSPFTQLVVLINRMILAHSMRNTVTSVSSAQEILTLSREHSYEYWSVLTGISLALTDDTAQPYDADKALHDALGLFDTMRNTYGNNLQYSRYLSWAIEICLRHGRIELGKQLIQRATSFVTETDERYCKADLLRLEGLLFLSEEGSDSCLDRHRRAERCFEEALAVAREQGAKIFELRAAVCLARLWHGENRSDESRSLLAPLYSSFTEGWATADLVAARELLEALGPREPVVPSFS